MIVCAELRPPTPDEMALRRKALKNAVICIAWLRLTSVVCYVMLYFLVHANSKGHFSHVLQIMTLAILPMQILHGIVLFLGALEEKVLALEISLWIALLLASYNTVLGMMGGIYFIRTGYLTMHFLLACIFGLMALSLLTVLCHDILIIFAYKQMLVCRNQPQNAEVAA